MPEDKVPDDLSLAEIRGNISREFFAAEPLALKLGDVLQENPASILCMYFALGDGSYEKQQ